MKKLLLLMIVAFFLLNIKVFSTYSVWEYNFSDNATAYISCSKQINSNNYDCVKNGNEFIYTLKFCEVKNFVNNSDSVLGITVKESSQNFEIYNFIEFFDCDVVKVNETENYIELLLYSKELNNYAVVENRKVNTQIIIKKDVIKIGYPVILQSF